MFGVYDSPTMLPRTPLAPETLLHGSAMDTKDNDDTSTDNGSSNGDHGGPAMDAQADPKKYSVTFWGYTSEQK